MRWFAFAIAVVPLASMAAAPTPTSVPAAVADISGKWKIDGDIVGNAVSLDCSVQKNAESKIAGKCTVNGMEPVDISGTVMGADFKFSLQAGGYTLTYSGTVEGENMKGGIEVAGTNGTFTGMRAKA